MRTVEELISKLTVLDEQLKLRDQRKHTVKYDDFAQGYLLALRWMLEK